MRLTDKELVRSHRLAFAAFGFGSLATVMINLAHAESGLGPKLAAIIAPISVLFVVEMALHVPMPDNERIRKILYGSIGVIGLSALIISYAHTAQLLTSYGESLFLAWIMPLVPDGMMVVSSICLALIVREKEKRADEKERTEQETRVKAEAAERRRIARAEKAKAEPKPAAAKASPAAKKPSAAAVQKEAQAAYVQSVKIGEPLTAVALAEKFGRKEAWGRQQIKAVEAETATLEEVA